MSTSGKKPKKFFRKILKLKFFIIAAFISVGVLVSTVVYYQMDPGLLSKLSFYMDLANPSMRIVRVQEGLRKEEIVEVIAKKLDWSETEENQFLNAHLALGGQNLEGKYFPKTYLIHKDKGPLDVSAVMLDEFGKQISKVAKPKSKNIIKEETILKIASLIQREAAGKGDMRLISGIIWNRIFAGMKLQVDATLQYAKGSEEDGWWPRVVPADKKIKSDYNTYLNQGLPPGPIANPGIDAIAAAYNPQKTACMFYLHDRKRRIHCAKTYEEHKRNIQIYY